MLGFQGGVSIPLVKGGVKAPPAKRQCRAGPKAGARRGFTTSCAHDTHIQLRQYVCRQWLTMWSRANIPEERTMEKTKQTVYYYTFLNDKGETVRPRRPGTLEAIKNTSLASATPLMSTGLEVDEADLDEDGFYPR